MIVTNPLEPYTMLMAIHAMDTVITVLCDGGLVYAPFAFAIITSIVEALTQGEDEGNAGELAVKFLRKKLLIMMPVFLLAFIPLGQSVKLQSSQVSVSSCEKSAIASLSDSSIIGNFSGGANVVPLWWGVVNDFSATFANVALASMPCALDMTAIQVNFSDANLPNLTDQQLAVKWNKQCLAPAANKVAATSPTYNDKWWVGHGDFTSEYAKPTSLMSMPTDVAIASGLASMLDNEAQNSATVSVSCLTAYNYLMTTAYSALSDKVGADKLTEALSSQKSISLNDAKAYAASLLFANVSNPLERPITINGQTVVIDGEKNGAHVGSEDQFSIAAMIAQVQQVVANVVNAPDAYVYRQGIPLQISVCLMVLLTAIPIVLVFSGYDISVCLLLSALYFGLRFTPVVAGFAAWADNLVTLISGSSGSANYDYLKGVGLELYTLLPAAWFLILGYIGLITVDVGFNSLGGAGQQAVKAVSTVAKAVAKAV